MTSKLNLITLSILGSILSLAVAEDGNTPTSDVVDSNLALPALSTMDKDKDGKVSRDEAFGYEYASKYWDKIDSNQDGYLDQKEHSKAEPIIIEEEARKTDHPESVQQYKDGKYISPEQQIERNLRQK